MSPNGVAATAGDAVVDVADNDATTPNASYIFIFALSVVGVVVEEAAVVLVLSSFPALILLQSVRAAETMKVVIDGTTPSPVAAAVMMESRETLLMLALSVVV